MQSMFEKTIIAQELAQKPLMSVDVGSRRGLQDFWRPYLPWMRVDAFEPDAEDCAKEQERSPENVRFIPVALAGETTRRKFYVLNRLTGSSLYPPTEVLNRYTYSGYGALKSVIDVECTSFSDYIRQYERPAPNLIKIDTQGAELEIMESLDEPYWPELYAVQCEVSFQEFHKGMPYFADFDKFMRDKGFYLADLHSHRSYRCQNDEQFYYLKNELGYAVGSPQISAELVEGEALYFRQPDEDYLYANRERFFKFMLILIIYKYYDLALWMADEAVNRGLLSADETSRLKQDLVAVAPRPKYWEKMGKGPNRLRKWLLKRFKFRPDVYKAFWLTRTWPNQ